MSQDCFCIFAGGGVRGTAYVGAMKALEELNINISSLAGSSVGAILSSLIAVGYTYKEIQDLLYEVNYQQFQDIYIPLGKDFGFFKGDGVYNWLKDKIEKKIYGENKTNNSSPVTFKDIEKELVIIAADVSYTEFKEYNRVKTPDVEIAYAARASISLPGFFKPVWENERCLVDGDVINNFPLWKIKSDIISNTNLKVLEFRLESNVKPRAIDNVFDYFNAILDTNYNIATDMLHREFGKNDQFEIIRVDTGDVKIIDFGVSNKEKEELINSGYNSIKRYFEYDLPEKRKGILLAYSKIKSGLIELQKFVDKNKTSESLINIGNLSIYFSENRNLIHKSIYNEFVELQNRVQQSLFSVDFLNINYLRDKKDILSRIERIIKNIETLS